MRQAWRVIHPEVEQAAGQGSHEPISLKSEDRLVLSCFKLLKLANTVGSGCFSLISK